MDARKQAKPLCTQCINLPAPPARPSLTLAQPLITLLSSYPLHGRVDGDPQREALGALRQICVVCLPNPSV